MNRSTWKRRERVVADQLGGERVPVTGRARGSAPDVAHPLWAIEVKARKQLPALLVKAMGQAKASVRGEQVPLVVLHELGKRDDLVVMRMTDFVDLLGPAGSEVTR